MKLLLLAGLLSAACTDFAPITRNVCGNGLIEEGEDCDSNDPNCVRCAVTCSAQADCPTADYECGVDGLCHAPGGGLAQPRAAGTFQADELHITDVDHDGIGDAVGLSRTSIVVRHGEATARLSALDSMVTPTQTGPAAFGDLDGDGSLDLALTTPDGLVSYASSYGELVPVAVNSGLTDQASGESLDVRAFVHVAPRVLAGFLVDPTADAVFMIVLDGSQGSSGNPQFFQPCLARLGVIKSANFDVASIDVYNVSRDDADQLDTVISFAVAGTPRRACVVSLHRNAPALFQAFPSVAIADVTPSAFSAAAKRPVLADLESDADPCPGVIRPDAGVSALVYFDGSRASATAPCTISTTSTALPPLGAPPTAELVGRVPVVPAVPLVAADGLVTSEGVYPFLPAGIPVLSPNPQFTLVYRTTRRIAKVDHGDLDGDGNVDAVLTAAGQEDLDFLFRVPQEAGFNLVRVDTASAVTHLMVGDFDGNRIADVAFTEALGDHERMLVAFGTPDRPLAPVSVGVFPGVLSLSRVGFPDTVDYLGLADDVIVLAPPAAGSTTLRMSLLHGSPQRTLLSYFDPRPDATKDETLFRGAVIGHFVSGGGSELRDLVAIAPPIAAVADVPGKDIVRAWRMPGTPDGVDATTSAGVMIDGLVDCSLARTGKLCLDLARYVAYPVADGRDVVIGIDRSNAAVMVDPWAPSVAATKLDALTAAIPASTQIHALHAADLDGDGTAELVAAFEPTATTARGAVIVCAMNGGMPTSCEDVVPAIADAAMQSGAPITQCLDAAPARIGYRDATTTATSRADIAVLCRGEGSSLFRVQRTASGTIVDRLATTGAELYALRAGDVTGDRVDDLVLLEGRSVTSLVVYPQCTSREARTCRGEEESP
jgi:hypothetical protein